MQSWLLPDRGSSRHGSILSDRGSDRDRIVSADAHEFGWRRENSRTIMFIEQNLKRLTKHTIQAAYLAEPYKRLVYTGN